MLFNYLQRVLVSFHWSWRDISHSAYLETPNVGTLCIRDSEREVRLWRDLIEFWVYGVWFAKLLIKHPRRGSRHTGTQITHQLCLTNCRVLLYLVFSFSFSLSFRLRSFPSPSCITFATKSLSSSSCFLCSCFRWLIFKLEFNPPMIPPFNHPHPCSTGSLASCCSWYCRCWCPCCRCWCLCRCWWFQHTWRGDSVGTSTAGATEAMAYTSIKSVSLADANILCDDSLRLSAT